MLSEFDLIARYFQQPGLASAGPWSPQLGIGDDCAVMSVPEGRQLAVSMDTLVADVHFPAAAAPELIGYRALAVTVSDLAAMGAEPAWFTLGLTLPEANPEWLSGFVQGLQQIAQKVGISLVGGDTTRGPLTITLQVHGLVRTNNWLSRKYAKPGDDIWVTGTLGDAAAWLSYLQQGLVESPTNENLKALWSRYYQPVPRVAEAQKLVALGCQCAIDISDGVLADLGHILTMSQVGALLDLSSLPASNALQQVLPDPEKRQEVMLTGGDDYELCFTAPPHLAKNIIELLSPSCPITRIGQINQAPGVVSTSGQPITITKGGYQHFS
ncbi:thiamine-phosphate kinase [Zooshikella harenae]|uniref:Thiamine-monophosphate kinase n=1 Tax=Zooshikella harenae TaxID=2827238 RepID=A0ABS5ZF38_9GAMM|nr:thiamine-phosphate kinase [Zooshikella harenae]MBU2712686.1 thiamine-phosphate kinase [Zooshikella harenae]